MMLQKDPNQDSTTNFYIGIKNVIIDSNSVNKDTTLTLLDWSVSQATQLTNIVFNMPNYSTGHTGIAMPEGGSGTMIGDLTFNGGAVGLNMNNQQYEGKSLSFNGCNTAIKVSHCFDCLFVNCNFQNCGTGIDMSGGSIGSVILLDSSASSVGTVINTDSENSGDHTLVVEGFTKGSSVTSVVVAGGNTILNSGVSDAWVYGESFSSCDETYSKFIRQCVHQRRTEYWIPPDWHNIHNLASGLVALKRKVRDNGSPDIPDV